jgi:hypothetical protein
LDIHRLTAFPALLEALKKMVLYASHSALKHSETYSMPEHPTTP